MGQHLFSRQLSKSLCTHRNETNYEYKHHKENLAVNGKTTNTNMTEDAPPNKRRRIFPSFPEAPPSRATITSMRQLSSEESGALKITRLRRKTQPAQANKDQTEEVKGSLGNRQSLKKERSRLRDKNNHVFHELRSSKKCQWIKDGLWMTQANNFFPPSCPENLSPIHNLSVKTIKMKNNLVEVPSFHHNPFPHKTLLHVEKANSSSTKASRRVKEVNLEFEDTSDDAFNRRHRKSEELEKKIVRWDRQRQRELEYYEYLRQKVAQRKTSQWVPNPVSNGNTSNATPSSKPNGLINTWNDDSLWPPLENIQFIEILPSDKEPVYVTLCGQPLPAVNAKAGFALPWSVDPMISIPSGTYPSATSSRMSPSPKENQRRKAVAKSLRKKLTAVKAAKQSRKEPHLLVASSCSNKVKKSPLQSQSQKMLIKLRHSKTASPASTLTTRRGQYTREGQSSATRPQSMSPVLRRSQRNR